MSWYCHDQATALCSVSLTVLLNLLITLFLLSCNIEMLWVSLLCVEARDLLHSMYSVAWSALPRHSLEAELASCFHQVSMLAARSRRCAASGLATYLFNRSIRLMHINMDGAFIRLMNRIVTLLPLTGCTVLLKLIMSFVDI